MELTERDLHRLKGVDSDLIRVVALAFRLWPVKDARLQVSEGKRTPERQLELWNQGRTTPGDIVTWSMNSKHLTGSAVDIVIVSGTTIPWGEQSIWNTLGATMLAAAKTLGVNIRWGADWDRDGNLRERGESDSPHFEIDDRAKAPTP